MSYKCKHFCIEELVPPEVFEARGEKAWELLDDRLLYAIDALRNEFGPATINNYKWGGDRTQSGLRTAGSAYFSPYSQHTFGRAADMLFKSTDVNDIRDWLKSDEGLDVEPTNAEWLEIKGIEDGVSWLHIDTRNFDGLKVFTA
tara:strand:+ start:3457 stop:3888 length:432 start_codon:yes stop_codon:yes gene_type:complete